MSKPSICPNRSSSDGSPQGESTFRQVPVLRPGRSYSPEPPTIPSTKRSTVRPSLKSPVTSCYPGPRQEGNTICAPTMMPKLSIIVPVLNEAASIESALLPLTTLRAKGAEVILVDGGSSDDTLSRARPLADQILAAPRGRASQMNAGAGHARGDILLFLHADTRLPDVAVVGMLQELSQGRNVWGRFDVVIEGQHPFLAMIAELMNWRSRLTGIATGDQAIFVRREVFEAIGGYPDIPLMEDIEISRRLRRLGWPLCIRQRVATSGRRWEKHGVLRTVFLMWRLRVAYYLGASPSALARRYGYAPRDE